MIRKLNIVTTYPVWWSTIKIFRDYIQNFYDALGYEHFKEFSFSYSEENMTLVMSAVSSFNKEWLFYMGASSKRNSVGENAGRFGEGFKIAALCSVRNMEWNVEMESEDWRLKVVTVEDHIEDRRVECLAYDISDRQDDGRSLLTLKNVKADQYSSFVEQISEFYYPDNERYGKELVKRGNIAVYLPSENYLKNCAWYKKGMLYLAYQVRYYLDFPLIICCHKYSLRDDDDRDREDLHGYEAEEVIADVLHSLRPQEAMDVLLSLKDYWHATGGIKRKSCHVSYFIRILIDRFFMTYELREKFYEEFKDKLITDHWVNPYEGRRLIAKKWFLRSAYHDTRRKVPVCFARLGIGSIEELCESENVFKIYDQPDEKEISYINVLNRIVSDFFGDIVVYEKLPVVRVLINDDVPIRGMESQRNNKKRKQDKKNAYGMTVQTDVVTVYIRRSILKTDCFEDALCVYLHELLHQFGGDNSAVFHKALMVMSKQITEIGSKKMDEYRSTWRSI